MRFIENRSSFLLISLINFLISIPVFSQYQYEEGYISENQKKIDILHYDLQFDLYPEDKYFIASATITGTIINNSISTIDLNFYDNFKIDKVFINGNNVNYVNEGKKLSITAANITDTFMIRIDYSGTPVRAGLEGFVFGKRDGYSLVYTLSEPNYASSWFPCNDLPSDKVLLDMKITNDSSRTSVSNGKLVSVKNNGDRRTYHWKTIYPISTYLIALYSADYESFGDEYVSIDKKDTMAIEYYVLPDKLENAKIDFLEHVEMMELFSKSFGEYPFIKEKYGVAEFLWMLGAMENQTITGVSSSLIGGKRFYNDFFAHELAHHWWGDAITPKNWNDIWLSEGFSTYAEALYFENKGGKKSLQSTMKNKYSSDFKGTLSNPGAALFNSTVYDKGAWTLHMLRWEVGDSIFFRILRSYFEDYKYGNASTKDFINISERLSGKDLTTFFEQFLNYEGEIKAKFKWNCSKTDSGFNTTIEFEQTQMEIHSYHFSLEIYLKSKGGTEYSKKVYVSERSSKFEITTDSEIEFVIVDPDNWLLGTFIENVDPD